MKPIILTAVVLLCFSFGPLQAQEMNFGIKGGINIGTPIGVAEKGASGSVGVGPLLGVYFKYDLASRWSISADFMYSYKGSKFNTPVSGDTIYKYNTISPAPYYDTIPSEANTFYRGTVDGKFDNRYIDVPIYASYSLSNRFLLNFGGYVSYLVSGKNTGFADIEVGDPASPFTTVEDEPFDQSDGLATWDYGALLGATYVTKHRLNFGISVTTGLRSVYKNNYKYIDGVVRNVYMQTFVQFRLNNKNSN